MNDKIGPIVGMLILIGFVVSIMITVYRIGQKKTQKNASIKRL